MVEGMELDRVERKTIKYDIKNRVVEEEWEFWFPPEKKPNDIGFSLKKKK
jgi:hypothetical protein